MNRAYAGAVAIVTGMGCATAIVDPDPGTLGPVGEGTGGVGGGSSVGGAGGTGGTAATGGSDATGGSTASGGDTSSGAVGGSVAGGRGGRSGTGSGGTQNPGAGRSGTGTSGGSSLAFGGRNTTGTGGGIGAAGRVGRGTGGMNGMMLGGAGASSAVACPMPRTPASPGATQGDSGSFATVDAVCYFVEGTFNAWNCSNLGGRTVTVNGKVTMCGGALPAPVDGGYYFEFGASAAGTEYTSFYWYSS